MENETTGAFIAGVFVGAFVLWGGFAVYFVNAETECAKTHNVFQCDWVLVPRERP
jgi:hypothetical protein